MYRHNVVIIQCFSMLLIGQFIRVISSGHQNALYIDNGLDQTEFDSFLSSDENTLLTQRILKALGLPERPKNPNHIPVRKRSAPKFLVSVYMNEMDTQNHQEQDEFSLTERDFQAINKSDVIISFMAQQPHQGLGGKPDHIRRIWIDVSEVPRDEILMSAELRLYRSHNISKEKFRGAFQVTVYRVLRRENDEKDFHRVDSKKTTASSEGWIVLNVTESLVYWMENPNENCGLYIAVTSIDNLPQRKIKPENIGIIGFDGDAEKQPFIAGFYKNARKKQLQLNVQSALKRYKRCQAEPVLNLMTKRDIQPEKARSMSCELKNFYVSFKDINWQHWIIAPKGYNAYHCSGECKYPFSSATTATNHAIVQALAHQLNPSVPPPCCAPTSYLPLSVLYFLDENNSILKKYSNMVVNGCACQ